MPEKKGKVHEIDKKEISFNRWTNILKALTNFKTWLFHVHLETIIIESESIRRIVHMNVKRNAESVKDSFLKMLQTRHMSDIPCKDIITSSHISKATFYKVFHGKEEVYSYCCVSFFEELRLHLKDYLGSVNPRKSDFFLFLNLRKNVLASLLNAYEDHDLSMFYLLKESEKVFSREESLLPEVLLEVLMKEEDVDYDILRTAIESKVRAQNEAMSQLRSIRV